MIRLCVPYQYLILHGTNPDGAMGLRFKTESHGGQRDSSLRERRLLLWGGDGTPFAVNRDSFCRQSGLLLPCNVTPFAVIWDSSPPPPSLALDNKTTQRQVFKTTTLPTCLPPKTQRPKDSDFEKYFLRKCSLEYIPIYLELILLSIFSSDFFSLVFVKFGN